MSSGVGNLSCRPELLEQRRWSLFSRVLSCLRTVGLLVVLVRDVDGESAAYPMWQLILFLNWVSLRVPM